MTEQKIGKRGRPWKTLPSKACDRYWAQNLRRLAPQSSFNALERKLFPHVKVTKRADGAGYSQPGTLAKVAAGTRFIGRRSNEVPEAISLGEVHVPTSSNCYRSVFWLALRGPGSQSPAEFFDRLICPEIECRFRSHHWTDRENLLLNKEGIRRAARLTHIDALGLLLMQCTPCMRPSHDSLTAERYVEHAFLRLCARDSVFEKLHGVIKNAMTVHFKHTFEWKRSKKSGPFQPTRISSFAVVIANMMDPPWLTNGPANSPR